MHDSQPFISSSLFSLSLFLAFFFANNHFCDFSRFFHHATLEPVLSESQQARGATIHLLFTRPPFLCLSDSTSFRGDTHLTERRKKSFLLFPQVVYDRSTIFYDRNDRFLVRF